jgi:hypothetical protein
VSHRFDCFDFGVKGEENIIIFSILHFLSFDFLSICHPRECGDLSPEPFVINGYQVQDPRIREDDKIGNSDVAQPECGDLGPNNRYLARVLGPDPRIREDDNNRMNRK